MSAAISVITLAVEDLERAVCFYRDGLGWSTKGIIGEGLPNARVAFFNLAGGQKLALWPRASLLAETGWAAASRGLSDPASPTRSAEGSPPRILLSHNVSDAEQVDQLLQRAVQAGACCVRAPYAPVWGGRVAFFTDLDAHLWELAWNPGFQFIA
ncbi:MAG: VOC family protein [Burkholderiaceae bacterium]